jgi:predicted nucleic acid-binding protein
VIVADASAVLEVLLNTPAAPEVGRRLFAEGETIHAPYLIDIEVLQVLRRHARNNEMGVARATQALQDYADIPVKHYPHKPLLPRIWELRHNYTAYDASYIALSEALDATLITRDRALASSSGHRAKVVVL